MLRRIFKLPVVRRGNWRKRWDFHALRHITSPLRPSELAANVLFHGGGGWLHAQALFDAQTQQALGLEVLALDHGPGIADIALALTEGYSTGKGLGCGLPGVKRLMDDFMIESAVGAGTCVKAIKWR